MIIHQFSLRVRYADTDQMGYVYYGNYPRYLEAGRTEMIRELGISYKEIEGAGVLMPVIDMHIRFRKPAKYDELLCIESTIPEVPGTRMKVNSKIYNENKDLLIEAEIQLAFVGKDSFRPQRAPRALVDLVEENWAEKE